MEIVDIQQHVTHFSEQLQHSVVHEQEVIVGGKIKGIVPPVDEEYPMYVVFLDDKVGVSHVLVPESMVDAFPNQFKTGEYIFVEGFVNVVTRSVKKDIRKEFSILAYSMKDITKVGDNES